MSNSQDTKKTSCQVGLLDSTNEHTPKTVIRSKHLLNTALDKVLSYSERKKINLDLFEQVLDRLARFDPSQSKIVELKFFGGLSTEETAKILGLCPTVVKREWHIAKMWLYIELKKNN